MSVFDSIYHQMTCPCCGKPDEFDIEVRFANANLKRYRINDFLTEDNQILPKSAFEIDGYTVCENHCHKDFFVKIQIVNKQIKSIEMNNTLKGYLD